MPKTIDTLIEDMYALLDPDEDHICNEENLDAFAEGLKNTIRDNLRKQAPRHGLRFSAIGKQPRQVWYDANANPLEGEKIDGQTMFKFQYGHMIEALCVLLIKESGHEVSCEQKEVECEGVKGHMDLVVDGVLLDVKSASPYGYTKFERGELTPEDDAFGYIRQLSGYATVEEKPAAFLAVEKVAGKMCISHLSSYAIEGHPPGPRILFLKQVIDDKNPPPRCYEPVPDGKSGNMKLGVGCSYCKWKWKCYPGLRGFAYSGGPRFLTNVSKVPDVPEFESPIANAQT